MLQIFDVRVRESDEILHFWRAVDDGTRLDAPREDLAAKLQRQRLDLWTLVCSALRIPWRLAGHGASRVLYVPALYERLARRNLAEMAAEGRFSRHPVPPPARKNAHWALAALSVLIFWYGVTRQWWFSPQGFTQELWDKLGALDVERTLHGEAYRALTALTLHADTEHLFGNLLFGAPFFILLCRRVGVGPGAALTLIAGSLGNLGDALYRETSHISLGFSTALFGVVGIHSALLASDEILHALKFRFIAPRLVIAGLRRAFVFMAAGVAVLAMLGADPSAKTDYAAHVFGLLAGVSTGLSVGFSRVFCPALPRRIEALCGIGALLALACAWLMALC